MYRKLRSRKDLYFVIAKSYKTRFLRVYKKKLGTVLSINYQDY
jgi:hypothetical protein